MNGFNRPQIVDVRLMAAALFLGLAATLAAVAGGYHAGFFTLQAIAGRLPPEFWLTVTLLGDEKVLLALSLCLGVSRPRFAWSVLFVAVACALVSQGLKHAVPALRPPAVLEAASFTLAGPELTLRSFPSGHTLSAFAMAGLLYLHAKSGVIRVLLFAVAALVGVSRVALGVHWPVDVLAGAALGLGVVAMAPALLKRISWGHALPGRVVVGMLFLTALGMLSSAPQPGHFAEHAAHAIVIGTLLVFIGQFFLLRPQPPVGE